MKKSSAFDKYRVELTATAENNTNAVLHEMIVLPYKNIQNLWSFFKLLIESIYGLFICLNEVKLESLDFSRNSNFK